MLATRWRRLLAKIGPACAVLGMASAYVASPVLGEESGATFKVLFQDSHVTVEAENARLDRILEVLAPQAGFTVRRAGSRYVSPNITGRRTGPLEEVLAWLLQTQNYVSFYADAVAGQADSPVTLSEILIMNPPRSGAPGAAHVAEASGKGGPGAATPRRAGASARAVPRPTERRARLAALEPAAPDLEDRDEPASGGRASQRSVSLSKLGSSLPSLTVDPSKVNIVRKVDLGDDQAQATHVMAHKAAGPSLQRTAEGAWVPWDGSTDTLIDNRFAAVDGSVAFDVIKGDLSDEFFPMTFTIAYRTGAGLKFGSFQVMPDQQPSL